MIYISVAVALTLVVIKVNRMVSGTLNLTPTTIKVNRILRHGSRKRGRSFQRKILPLSMGIDSTLVSSTG